MKRDEEEKKIGIAIRSIELGGKKLQKGRSEIFLGAEERRRKEKDRLANLGRCSNEKKKKKKKKRAHIHFTFAKEQKIVC